MKAKFKIKKKKVQNKESVKSIGIQIWNPKQNPKQTLILCNRVVDS